MAFEKSGSSVGEEREVTDLLEPIGEVTKICQCLSTEMREESGLLRLTSMTRISVWN